MYEIVVITCLAVAIHLFRKDARSIVPAALIVIALLACLFGVDYLITTRGVTLLGSMNRVVGLVIYTVAPLFSAAILFIYADTVLEGEVFNRSHKVTLAAGLLCTFLAIYHIVYFRLGLPDTTFDLYIDILTAVASYITFMYLSYRLASRLYNARQRKQRAAETFDFIMVLGHRLNGDKMEPLLVSRLDTAYEFWCKTGSNTPILLSGGQCFAGTRPESHAMREYLLGRGVPNEMLLVEDRSTTTKQNMLLSQELMSSIKENPRCLIITSEFHVMRGLAMARQVGIDAEGLGSKTRYNPLFIGLSTREMVSFIFQRKEIAIMFIEAMMFLEAWRYVTIPTGIFS